MSHVKQALAEHLLSLRDGLHAAFDPDTGSVDGVDPSFRRLSELRGCYADADAFEAALAESDPVIYSVSSVAPAEGPGQLHYGIGRIEPGRIGAEYHLTKGHYHTWRDAAEIYIGLSGEGAMLLEDEATGESRLLPLRAHNVVYVPGHTAHRTINTGTEPLIYVGIYPAEAGHDYGSLAERNFSKVLVAGADGPQLRDRSELVARLAVDS